MEYALSLLIPVLLFMAAGIWLDKATHLGFVFTLLGSIAGMAVGIGSLYKQTMNLPSDPIAKPEKKKLIKRWKTMDEINAEASNDSNPPGPSI